MTYELIYLAITAVVIVGVLFLFDRLRFKAFTLRGKTPEISHNPTQHHLSQGVRTMLMYFMTKSERNKVWGQLTAGEKAEHCRHVYGNLVLHPTRVEDYKGALNTDKEYGGDIPVENFAKIYSIEPKPPEF